MFSFAHHRIIQTPTNCIYNRIASRWTVCENRTLIFSAHFGNSSQSLLTSQLWTISTLHTWHRRLNKCHFSISKLLLANSKCRTAYTHSQAWRPSVSISFSFAHPLKRTFFNFQFIHFGIFFHSFHANISPPPDPTPTTFSTETIFLLSEYFIIRICMYICWWFASLI